MDEIKTKLLQQLHRAIESLEGQDINNIEDVKNFMFIIQQSSQIISVINNLN